MSHFIILLTPQLKLNFTEIIMAFVSDSSSKTQNLQSFPFTFVMIAEFLVKRSLL